MPSGGGGGRSPELEQLAQLGGIGQQAPQQGPGLLQMAQAAMGDGGGWGGGGWGADAGQSSDPYAAERARYGSFDLNRNAEPIISDAAQAAEQGGTSLAGLMGGFFPRASDGVQSYQIPSDQGGFFTAEDLFRHSPQGSVPQMGTFMQNRPSTNNWRLLGRGPGWILRNGSLIDTNAARWGGPASWMPSGGATGEMSMPAVGISLGTGRAYGAPGLFAPGYAPASYGWPGADTWFRGAWNPYY